MFYAADVPQARENELEERDSRNGERRVPEDEADQDERLLQHGNGVSNIVYCSSSRRTPLGPISGGGRMDL